MPRNGSGVYTLPAGNPVVPGTTIDAAWANSTLNDIANELTNSLSRTGAGGMIAPFRIADGNITAPGLSFLNETGSGLYRSGAGSVWMSILGTNTMQFATTAVTVASSRTLNALGNALVGGTLGVTGATTLASTLAVTGALTATGGVLGNITAASGTSTFHDVLINGSLDMAVGSSATITGLSTPTNASDAANKGYVDTQDALRLALTGGTMSGAIAMGANKITGLGTPSADTDAANKAYVDSVAQGLDIKASVRAATTTNISLSGAQTIDGVAVIAGDRVLVKNQSSAADNGIYVASASTWARASDANTWDKLVGAFTFVEDGSTNDNSGWVCAIAPGGTLGVTAVTWEQFSGAGQITAGAGLTKTGNTLNVGTASSARIVVGADEIDLAQTGVSAGTYKSVTVDLFGRVTAGTNPTTLAGYGITDAYTNTQTDTLLNGKLSLTGGTMTGSLAMGTNRITGMGDPVNAQDAATKNYIDTIFGSTSSAAASAAAAASSASAASTSASNASTSASNASSSASAAAASAASAAASYDSFDDRYLGAKSSDPTVDNDGNALITGALYWNTVGNIMKTWTGTAWVSSINPISMPDGTVNGVTYLNGSKVLTTGSALTFDGAILGVNGVSVGRGAGAVSTNTAVGASALAANTTGAYNTALGSNAGDSITSGNFNTMLGYAAGSSVTTASANTAVGQDALSATTTGANNVALGNQALQNNTTASNNTAVGYQAGYSSTTGTGNTFLGNQAGLAVTTSSGQTFIGSGAGASKTTGGNNTFVGSSAGGSATTGTGNTFVGVNDSTNGAGYAVTTGSKNTILGGYTGNQANLDIRTANNWLVLSDGDGNPLISATAQTGQVYFQQVGYTNRFPGIKQSGFGYSQASYGALVVGAPVGWNQTVSINYDPSSNASGSFSGTGGEVMFRNAVRFIQPNSTDNGYHAILQFDSSGYGFKAVKCIGVGDADPATSGAGITFPATQSASSNANTLDDYEEGTWTPVLYSEATNTSSTYTVQEGRYTKIGNMVYIRFGFLINVLGGGGSSGGAARVYGLPFTNVGISYADSTGTMGGTCFTATESGLAVVANGDSWLSVRSGNGASTDILKSDFANGTFLFGSFFYNVS